MHSEEDKVDVLIIGGGASGVTSGIQSARTDCRPDFGENLRIDCLIIMAGWIL